MINHISIAVENPEKVANVIAELWNGAMVVPFPPAPGAFIVIAGDGRGSAVEIAPRGTVLMPGEGLPPEDDANAPTEEFEARFVNQSSTPQYVATHLNINTHLSIEQIKEIGRREGWRTLVCNRDKGLFQLVEMWVENSFLLEVMTPEQTERYIEITRPEFLAEMLGMAIPQNAPAAESLNLIG